MILFIFGTGFPASLGLCCQRSLRPCRTPVLCAQCCSTVGLLPNTAAHNHPAPVRSLWLMSALAGTASSELHSPGLQHKDSPQLGDFSRREDRYKWLQSAGKSSAEELLTVQVYIPCKALSMASLSFVPAQCSSVKP